MPTSPSNPFRAACALVRTPASRGSGFLISPTQILTCYHVIEAGIPAGHVEVTLGQTVLSARVGRCDAERDCAVLDLETPITDIAPLNLASSAVPKNASWESFGFPAVIGTAGLLISGHVQDEAGEDSLRRRSLVLWSANITASSHLEGLSGSPVVVQGKVIGQLKRIVPDASHGAQFGVVYASPAEVLAELMPEYGALRPAESQTGSAERATALAEYLRQVGTDCQHPRVGAVEQEETAHLLAQARLDDLYVLPTLQEEQSFLSLADEVKVLHRRLESPGLTRKQRREVQQQLSKVEHQRWGRKDPEQVKPLSLKETLNENLRFVLIGTPGAGKTTLLRYLAWVCAGGPQEQRKSLGVDFAICPMLIALRDYSHARRKHPGLELDRFIRRRLGRGGGKALRDELRQQLQTGHALVLLDALDEVPTEAERRAVAESIAALLARYPKIRCVVTTRPYGYAPIPAAVNHFRLRHLTDEQVAELVRKRQMAIEMQRPCPDRGRARATARRVINALRKHAPVAQLARNPLLLVMICELCQEGRELPVERAQLYDRAVHALADRWNRWRSVSRSAALDDLDPEELIAVLSQVALRQLRARTPAMHRAQLRRWLAAAIKKRGHSPKDADILARSYLQAATCRAGLLDERGPDYFVFWHQSLQEYLAAVALVQAPGSLATRLARYADRPRWHEVLQLALGYVGRVCNQPPRAVKLLMTLRQKYLPRLEAALHTRLCAIASLLAQNPWLDSHLANEVLAELAEATYAQPFAPLGDALSRALAARPGLIPDDRLRAALLPLTAMRFRYFAKVRLGAMRVLANVPLRSSGSLAPLRELLKPVQEEDETSARLFGSDSTILCCAAVHFIQDDPLDPRVLLALAPFMEMGGGFIELVRSRMQGCLPRVLPPLRNWLSTEGPSLRASAAEFLALLDHQDDEVVEALLDELDPEPHSSRRYIGAYEFVSALARQHAAVRRQILLRAPATKQPRHERPLDNLVLALLRDSDEFLDEVVACIGEPTGYWRSQLMSIGADDARIAERLRPILSADDLQLRYLAAVALEQLGDPCDLVPALLSCLDSPASALRLQSSAALLGVHLVLLHDYVRHRKLVIRGDAGQVVPQVLACLRWLLVNGQSEEPSTAAFLLALLDQVDEQVIEVMTDERAMRRGDWRDLWELFAPRLRPFRSHIEDRLVLLVGSGDPVLRFCAAKWLDSLSPLSDAALALLDGHLDSAEPGAQATAGQLLYKAGRRDARLQLALLSCVGKLKEPTNRPVHDLLKKLDPPDRSLLGELLRQLAKASQEEVSEPQETPLEDPSEKEIKLQLTETERRLGELLGGWACRCSWVIDAVVDLLRERPADIPFTVIYFAVRALFRDKEAEASTSVAAAVRQHMETAADPVTRYVLAETLLWFGHEKEVAEQIFLRLLDAPNLRIRYEAIVRLPEAAQSHPDVVRALASCLTAEDPQLRMRAALRALDSSDSATSATHAFRSLLEVEEQWSREHLLDAVTDNRSRHPDQDDNLAHLERPPQGNRPLRLCEISAHRLCLLGAVDEEVLQILISWLKDSDPIRRLKAARYLRMLPSEPPELEAALLGWLSSGDRRLRTAAVRSLHQHSKHQGTVEGHVLRWFESGEQELQQQAIELLEYRMQLSDEALTWIVRRAMQQNVQAVQVINRLIQRHSQGVLRAFERELRSPDLPHAMQAARWLIEWEYLTEEVIETALRGWVSLGRVLTYFVDQLFDLGNSDVRIQSALLPYLYHEHWSVRHRAAVQLLEYGHSVQAIAAVLRPGLESTDSDERLDAAYQLIQIADPSDRPRVIRALLELAQAEESPEDRYEILRPIEAWPEVASQVEATYEALLSSSHWYERWRAIKHYLKGSDFPAPLRARLQSVLWSDLDMKPDRCLDGLLKLGLERRAFLKQLLEWLGDGEAYSSYRREAVKRLRAERLLKRSPDGLRIQLVFDNGMVDDHEVQKILSLAREPLVPILFAEIAAPAMPAAVSAIERLRDAAVQPADPPILAELVRGQPTDTAPQRLARCWLFYWMAERRRSSPRPVSIPSARAPRI